MRGGDATDGQGVGGYEVREVSDWYGEEQAANYIMVSFQCKPLWVAQCKLLCEQRV